MKRVLLGLIMLFSLQPLHSQKSKQQTYVPSGETGDTSFKNTNASFECRVYEITNQYRQTSIILVLIETGDAGNKAQTKLRTEYLFKREKTYLKNVFFAEVKEVDHFASVVDVPSLLQKLKEQYYKPQLWSVLNADRFFNTAPQRSGNLFALHR
jgi:hypothetical protein